MATVLIVDDDVDTTDILVETLRLEGWGAVGAYNGEQALEIARGVRIRAVVTDLCLPGMDGAALERAFREDPALATVPFLFMTGFRPAVQRFGADRVLLKPFRTTELDFALRRALGTP